MAAAPPQDGKSNWRDHLSKTFRVAWSALTDALPAWLVVVSFSVAVAAVTGGLSAEIMGWGPDHPYAVNILSALTGTGLGLPLISAGVPAIARRQRLRFEATGWAELFANG